MAKRTKPSPQHEQPALTMRQDNPKDPSDILEASVASPELRALIERFPLWRRPGYLVRRLHQLHHAIFLDECGSFDLTPVQYALMTVLSLRATGDQQTLATEIGLDRTNVADVLLRLERRGVVMRAAGAEDRRTRVATLTKKGRDLTHQMHGAMVRVQERLLSPLDDAEQEVFVRMLLRLIDANNQYGRAPLGAGDGAA